jgi:predicted O-methyltransferase YrrM
MVVSQVNISKSIKILGWMSERELTWLATRAKLCSSIVEFGSFRGRSTRALADNTDGVVYAVDPWNGDYPGDSGEAIEEVNTYVYPQFKENLKDHIESGKVIPVRSYSDDFDPSHQVDMVFIDGDHNYKAVFNDISHAIQLVRSGGLICGHDFNNPGWPDVNKAVTEIFGSVENLEGEMIWWIQKY